MLDRQQRFSTTSSLSVCILSWRQEAFYLVLYVAMVNDLLKGSCDHRCYIYWDINLYRDIILGEDVFLGLFFQIFGQVWVDNERFQTLVISVKISA